MKRIAFSVVASVLLCSPLAAFSHPLADKARAIEEQARLLHQRMAPAQGTQLSWGQQMAYDDMNRLVAASTAAQSALQPDDAELAGTRAQVTELQVAGNRVRMTLSVANLDDEGRKIGEQMVAQIKEFEQEVAQDREQGRVARSNRREYYSSRPSVSLGLGFGNYWGSPWGWGYPGFGSGLGFGYPAFYRGGFYGGGFNRGGRCR